MTSGYVGLRALRQLLDAVQTIAADLDLEAMLRRIISAATDLVDARYGALGVLDESRTRLKEFITVGLDDDQIAAISHRPQGEGILGLLIVDAKPLRLPDLTAHPASFGFPAGHPPMHSFLGVPIVVREEVFGNLYLTDKTTSEAFSDIDEELVVGLAGAAGVAIENARLVARVHELALAEDRERIARDLHDTVIQRLFATGMSLQSTLSMLHASPDLAVGRISQAVDDLDMTIKDIRTAIFSLEQPTIASTGVRDQVSLVVREAARGLGFDPRLTFEGPVDTVARHGVTEAMVVALREMLSNVARHARASRVDVVVAATDRLVVRVSDNGIGPVAKNHSGRGLRNLQQRAAGLGGTFELRAGADGGATAEWSVPV
jgi:signal transduction histidine kinase